MDPQRSGDNSWVRAGVSLSYNLWVGIVVTSMLEFQGLEEEDTGGIQCVGYQW